MLTWSNPSVAFNLLPRDIFEQFSSYPLSVIPMFVMMGVYAFASGIGKRLFDTAYVLLGHMPGGLTVATIAASTGFGAICGSTSATCATIGKVAIPEMKRHGYKDWLSTGSVTVAGRSGYYDSSQHHLHRLWYPDRTIDRQAFYQRYYSGRISGDPIYRYRSLYLLA